MFLLLSASALSAQHRTLPPNLDGTMMPYDFTREDSSLDIPDSLEVVHVCYVARHGARYISSSKKVTKLTDILEGQSETGSITNTGIEFLSLLKTVSSRTGSRWGALSDVGIMEQQKLASEMAGLFPELLDRGNVQAKSTYVPRVVMTMYEFLHSLAEKKQALDIYTVSGPVNDTILRCFDTDSGYARYRESGEWKKVYDVFVASHVPSRPAKEIFGLKDADDTKAKSLTMDIYSVLQSLQAMGLPAPTDQWMTKEEYRLCWEAANIQRYLRNTLNPLSEPYVYATAPLIKAIIEDADRNTTPKSPSVPLSCWFGHAETLMPMLSVMGIPGCSYFTDNWNSVADHWQSQDVVPLGANFMIILLKSKTGSDVYAMIRLNGRCVPAIPNRPVILPWFTLKSFWESRLRAAKDL